MQPTPKIGKFACILVQRILISLTTDQTMSIFLRCVPLELAGHNLYSLTNVNVVDFIVVDGRNCLSSVDPINIFLRRKALLLKCTWHLMPGDHIRLCLWSSPAKHCTCVAKLHTPLASEDWDLANQWHSCPKIVRDQTGSDLYHGLHRSIGSHDLTISLQEERRRRRRYQADFASCNKQIPR